MIDTGLFLDTLRSGLTPGNLLMMFAFLLLGVLCGALPGVSSTMSVALLLPFTYGLDPFAGVMMLIATYAGSTFGGSIAGTLLNIPGTPAAAATTIEAYALNLRGEAGRAMSWCVVQSAIGQLIGAVLLLFTAPFMVQLALEFGPWEYFWFCIFGVFMSANLSSENTLKGMIGGILGLLIGMVGMDPVFGYPRYSFGHQDLIGGIGFIPALIGLFGMGEVLFNVLEARMDTVVQTPARFVPRMREVLGKANIAVQTAILGFIVGAIPGTGADIAAWVGYDHARRLSKQKEEFGRGAVDGIVGAETANNACVAGVFLPLLTLAIPGDSVTAVVLGALLLHNVRPGPTLFMTQPQWFYWVVVVLALTALMILLSGFFVTHVMGRVISIQKGLLMSIVVVLTITGAYLVNLNRFDVAVMFIFGLFGVLLRRYEFPLPPLVLGLVLGPLLDTNFRRAVLSGRYELLPFVTRPLSLIILGIIVAFLVGKILAFYRSRAANAAPLGHPR